MTQDPAVLAMVGRMSKDFDSDREFGMTIGKTAGGDCVTSHLLEGARSAVGGMGV